MFAEKSNVACITESDVCDLRHFCTTATVFDQDRTAYMQNDHYIDLSCTMCVKYHICSMLSLSTPL